MCGGAGCLEGVSLHLFLLLRASSSAMKGSRTLAGPPEGSPERVDLSLTGFPPPVSRRPNSASAAKPVTRSISVVTGSEPRKKALVSGRAGASGPPPPGESPSGWHLTAPPQQPPSRLPSVCPCGRPGDRRAFISQTRELPHKEVKVRTGWPEAEPRSCRAKRSVPLAPPTFGFI